MIQKIFSICLLFVVVFTSCKKENEEKVEPSSNISLAPKVINQSFNVDITIENKKVVEVVKRTGVTEFSKTTYKYTPDTIFETIYELGKRSFLRKHRLDAEVISSTVDSSFGRDTVEYFRVINYAYVGGKMTTMVINHSDILDLITKTTTTSYSYLYKEENLFETSYEAQNNFDSTYCNDRFEYYSYETILDVKNILGIDQGSTNKKLVSKSAHLINCNTNGATGSTSYEYWYALNDDKRITELVYRKTFNGIEQTFKENYKYIIR